MVGTMLHRDATATKDSRVGFGTGTPAQCYVGRARNARECCSTLRPKAGGRRWHGQQESNMRKGKAVQHAFSFVEWRAERTQLGGRPLLSAVHGAQQSRAELVYAGRASIRSLLLCSAQQTRQWPSGARTLPDILGLGLKPRPYKEWREMRGPAGSVQGAAPASAAGACEAQPAALRALACLLACKPCFSPSMA